MHIMKVIVGIGVPGCGKTTYLKPLADKLRMVYINPDDIRQEITGDPSDHTKEMEVWAEVHARLRDAIKTKGAVVDATYTKKRDRRELINISREGGAKEIIAYWFNLPVGVCVARNNKRERVVPEEVIEKMHNRLVLNPPTPEEGFDKVIEITS
jgi:predicted kinase